MIEEFVEYICGFLNIEVPEVRILKDEALTDTTLACVIDGVVYVKTMKPSPDLLFSAAHELRHLWQAETDRDLYFKDYKTLRELEDVDAYNQQLAELDANAFASAIMAANFGISPTFDALSEDTKALIKARAKELWT